MTGGVGNPTTAAKQTQLSRVHQTYPCHCTAIHHKQCFHIDVPPVAHRVSKHYADQGQLFLPLCFQSLQFPSPRRGGGDARGVLMRCQAVRGFKILARVRRICKSLRNKVAQREPVETRCFLDSPPRAFTESRVHTVCCDSGVQATGGPNRDVAVEAMPNRLLNLCRTVSQSLRKNPTSEFAWQRSLCLWKFRHVASVIFRSVLRLLDSNAHVL